VAKKLCAQQVQAQDELERHWSAVSEWLGGLLIERGVDRIAAEELTVPPGGDELFSLLFYDLEVISRRVSPARITK
jgi:arsenite-transporting ATPase